MKSLAQCRKLIEQERNKDLKPTISHYRDIENGMLQTVKNGNYTDNFTTVKTVNGVRYEISCSYYPSRKRFSAVIYRLPEYKYIGMSNSYEETANMLTRNSQRKNPTRKTAVNPSSSAKSLVHLRNKVRLRTGNGARPVALESFTDNEQEKILNNAKYFEVSGGYVYLKKKNPTRQNYDEHAIFETHIDETLDNNAALFHGRITGKQIKTVGSDYTNSRVTRLGKLHSFIVVTDDNQEVEIKPSRDAWLSMDIRRNLQFDGRGVQFPKNLHAKHGQLILIGKLKQIDYLAAKAHIEAGKMCRFYHELGEATGEVPTLWIDKDGMPIIIGGNYDVWKSGIVN